MSIKAKQVAGVTTLVVVVVSVLSAYHLAALVDLTLRETASRGEMLAQAIYQRAHQVVVQGADPYAALRDDGGVRSILESTTAFSSNVTYAAIVGKDGVAFAHCFRQREGQPMPETEDLVPLVAAGTLAQLRAVYSGRVFEVRKAMVTEDRPMEDRPIGDIRIGVSTLLVREELRGAFRLAAGAVVVALIVSSLFALVLSNWILRPIHVIQSGLTRLGRGELNVTLDLPGQEFRGLGSSFDAVSAQLSALGRPGSSGAAAAESRPGERTDLESVMDNLEDAVALFSPAGELIFSNAAMKVLLPGPIADLPATDALRQLVERTLAGRQSAGPVSIASPGTPALAASTDPAAAGADTTDPASRLVDPGSGHERLLMSHAIADAGGRFLGAMLVARNIGYLSQVHSTLNYSRKLAALGRLMAGVAHEVKNPLNAMTIHLELLKTKMAARIPDPGSRMPSPDLSKHVEIIASEIRRLDDVVNGFLKFARPEELKLQPVQLRSLISDVTTTAGPEAERRHVIVKIECPESLPPINADPGMLGQAVLNLVLNACQAMPDGGTLKITCRAAARRFVELDVEDTGVGIPPEHLSRIFDLYFTTKETGSGIGLSMVYRIVQLHDGEVEVQSTPGRGTRFRLIFPQA